MTLKKSCEALRMEKDLLKQDPNLPTSYEGTCYDLSTFENELRSTTNFFVIPDNVSFACFNGGGS
jgi:hypothetical protein